MNDSTTGIRYVCGDCEQEIVGGVGACGCPALPDEVWDAIGRAADLRPRPARPAAVALLMSHAHHLGHFGGCSGLLDVCDAAAFLTWALAALRALLMLARG